MTIAKRFRFKRSTFDVDYTIENASDQRLRTTFAPELNFAFLSQEVDSLRLFVSAGKAKPQEIGSEAQHVPAAGTVRLDDLVNGTTLTLSLASETELWMAPVETVSHCVEGLETRYQGTSVVPRYAIDLDPGASLSTTISIGIERS